MPSWKIHLIFNLIFIPLFWKIFLGNLFSENLILFFFLLFLYELFSIFPDIDTSKSKIRDCISLILAAVITVMFMFNINMNSVIILPLGFLILYLIFKYFPTKHRGFTHSLWFSVFLPLFFIIIIRILFSFSFYDGLIYFMFLFSGYIFHIILDKI